MSSLHLKAVVEVTGEEALHLGVTGIGGYGRGPYEDGREEWKLCPGDRQPEDLMSSPRRQSPASERDLYGN